MTVAAIRLGVVGAGIMGRRVGAVAAASPRFEPVAVADSDPGRARALGSELGAASYGSVRELCAAGGLDAVYVGLPHRLHLEACLAAAEAGLHVLVDKPLCTTVAEADAIRDAAATSDRVWMVGFSYRYRAEWQLAQALVSTGALGRPYFASDTSVEAYAATPGWYWEEGGGALHLQSHHSFDRLAWILGSRPAEIACRVVRPPGSADVSAQIAARYESGVQAGIALSFGRSYDAAPRSLFVVQAERGMLEIDERRVLRVTTAEGTVEEDHGTDDWLRRELAAFAAAVDGSGAGYPGLAEGRAAVLAAAAAGEAAEQDRWVRPGA
ncbi:MAG: Gfo/Idh/MocA family oxidoreductase [Nocardioidaceae bacterium]|nr:Gfo/Idh/MocA family oxidoreductase [Nocardioidaceae bacterium]